jgi:hypothetical protein
MRGTLAIAPRQRAETLRGVDTMLTLCRMDTSNKIIVEDHTTETAEQRLAREVLTAGQLVVGFTIQVSGARPPVGLGALAFALGMGGARVGATLEQIQAAVRYHYEQTRSLMAAEDDEADVDEGADAEESAAAKLKV